VRLLPREVQVGGRRARGGAAAAFLHDADDAEGGQQQAAAEEDPAAPRVERALPGLVRGFHLLVRLGPDRGSAACLLALVTRRHDLAAALDRVVVDADAGTECEHAQTDDQRYDPFLHQTSPRYV
jgi:hypothetical protein